jgi:ABC-type antimicrobial peptide transport system permease subunit
MKPTIGESFDQRDKPQSEPALIINEKMAKSLWPAQEAVGQVAVINGNDFRVIGVAGNVRHTALEAEGSAEMYILGVQRGWSSMDLVVRARGSIGSLVSSVRAALRQVDANLPLNQFQTLQQIVDQAVSPRKFITLLLAGFSFLALLMASVGIYAVIAYSAGQRTHEIGIRLALGASARDILFLIIGQGMFSPLLGLAVGVSGMLALNRVLVNLLYEVKTTDPLTILCVIALVLLVALAACYAPARRATRIDPMTALRYE